MSESVKMDSILAATPRRCRPFSEALDERLRNPAVRRAYDNETEQEVGGSSPPAAIDLATFVPRCEVCTLPIPMRRLTGRDALRTRHTCSAKCEKVLREADKLRTSLRKCRNCQHPSTPAERDEFRLWRKSRGDLRQGVGNPERWPQTRGARIALAAGLRRALELLGEEAVFKPEVAAFREEMQNLIDGEGASKRTLRADGGKPAEASEGDDNGIS